MLTIRQINILKQFIVASPNYLTSKEISEAQNISVRTVKSEVSILRAFIKDYKDIELVSVRSLGTKITFVNSEEKIKYMNLVNEEYSKVRGSTDIKITYNISCLLLEAKNYISLTKLMSSVYISESTLLTELKKISTIIDGFNLTLENKRGSGYKITGSERNKRLFMVSLGIYGVGCESIDHAIFSQIEDILTNTLLEYKYQISDTIFQNLIVHLYASINRMKLGFSLDEDLNDSNLDSLEIEIASVLLERLKLKLLFDYSQREILNLAIYLKGKSDYDKDDYISTEINDFILYMLLKIKENFNINFTQEIDLRISLGLHFVPLLTRIKYDIQLKNQLLKEIKTSFPLAFDIGVYASYLINEKYNTKLEEGEIAYLAIYFNKYIESLDRSKYKKNMLVITSMKRSESILFRQRIFKWFGSEIDEIILINEHHIEEVYLEKYELLFTTEKKFVDKYGAIYVSMYPTELDYPKIKLAVDGFKDKQTILSMFSKDRFLVTNLKNKDQILDKICEISNTRNVNLEELKKAVMLREDLGSTYFGNSIAFPHPINPISFETYVSVILLEEPIIWDNDKNEVSVVVLVVIEKNNFKAFQLWNYLSTLIEDKQYVYQILKRKSYENFISVISNSIDITLGG